MTAAATVITPNCSLGETRVIIEQEFHLIPSLGFAPLAGIHGFPFQFYPRIPLTALTDRPPFSVYHSPNSYFLFFLKLFFKELFNFVYQQYYYFSLTREKQRQRQVK